jgi:hypothetical protein
MGPRDLLIVVLVLVVLFGVLDRGARVAPVYPGSVAGLIVLIIVVAWLFGWF